MVETARVQSRIWIKVGCKVLKIKDVLDLTQSFKNSWWGRKERDVGLLESRGRGSGAEPPTFYRGPPHRSQIPRLGSHRFSLTPQTAQTDAIMGKVEELRRKVAEAELDLRNLKEQLTSAEKEAQEEASASSSSQPWKWPLQPEDYERYGRQLIIPQVGVKGELY